jgi:hypothetical protein
MSTKLNFARDVQGYNSFAPPVSTDMFKVTIAAAGNSTLTLPTNALSWVIAYAYTPGAEVWVAYNTTATAPSSGTFSSSNCELNPGARTVLSQNITSSSTSATTINFYNNGSGTATVWVGLYANT